MLKRIMELLCLGESLEIQPESSLNLKKDLFPSRSIQIISWFFCHLPRKMEKERHHLFTQQIFTRYLLYARHWTEYLGYKDEWNRSHFYGFMDDPRDTLLHPSTPWTTLVCLPKLPNQKSEIWNYFSLGKDYMVGSEFLVATYLKKCIILAEEKNYF